jgi:hypothetical protein
VEYERHQKEHKIIDQFQGNVEKCREAEVKFHGEELKIYGERMTVLQKAYNELLVLSNKRVSDLHSLYDFMQVRRLLISMFKIVYNLETVLAYRYLPFSFPAPHPLLSVH